MIQVIVIKAGHDVGLWIPALLDLDHGRLIYDHGLPLRVFIDSPVVDYLEQVHLQGIAVP